MDMTQVNAAVEGEKQRAQALRIETALADIVGMLTELRADVAELKAKRTGKSLEELSKKYDKSPKGDQTQE